VAGTARADVPGLVATLVSPDVTFEQRMRARFSLRDQPSEEVLTALVPLLWQTVPEGQEDRINVMQEPISGQSAAKQAFNAVKVVWFDHIRATEPVPAVGRLLLAQLPERRAQQVVTFVFTAWNDKVWVPEAGAAFTKLALDPGSEGGVRRGAARIVLNHEADRGFVTARKAFYMLPEDDYQSQLSKANLITEILTAYLAKPTYTFEDKDKFIQSAFRFIETTGQKQPSTMYFLIRVLGPVVGQKFVPDAKPVGQPDYSAIRDSALDWWAHNRF
jgi:hypothetical protein